MGTCQSEHELTIKIESAETDNRKKNVFDFHASSLTVSTSRLLFPSYLNRNANQQIEFSYRSKYDTREYEIG